MFAKKNKASVQSAAENAMEKNLIPFLISSYQTINVARLQHLDSLELPIQYKKVVDLGAGIGDHTLYYLFKNCQVLPVEGRADLADFIANRFGIKSVQKDFETESKTLRAIGEFDIIHCYGLLYHLSNPAEFLSQLSSLGNLLFMETCVSGDDSMDPINLVKEDKFNPTQAISGIGCRPTRKWIISELRRTFPYVYLPATQPKHNQFPLNWNELPTNQNIRAIFIGSKERLSNAILTEDFITEYKQW